MKSIKSLVKWILFVPVSLMSVALITICGISPDAVKNYFTTDMNGIAEIIAFSVLGLFLACFVLSLFDRTTSPVHLLKKNYFSGAVSFITAFGLASTAALDVTSMVQTGSIELMPVITAVFTILSGVAMLFIGVNHFTGTNTPREVSIFYLALPLWCGVHLIDRFLKHTAMPVAAADTLDLIMFVALAMFFINAIMVHAVIPGKNAVKAATTFGFPAVVISLVYGISLVFNVLASDSSKFIDFIPAVTYCMMGLYVLAFTAELSFKSKSVEEQMVLDTAVDSEETEDGSASENDSEETPTDEAYEETSSYDSDDTSVPEDITIFDEAEPAVVRVVEDDYEETDGFYTQAEIPVNLPAVDELVTSQCDIAEELYAVAQERDSFSEKEADVQPVSTESEEGMIIDGEETITSVPVVKPSATESRPKGPTSREAVMYEDDDFILAIDGSDVDVDEPADDTEDISSFILEDHEEDETPENAGEKTYADRLDEIDQLIISIQGGDSPSED